MFLSLAGENDSSELQNHCKTVVGTIPTLVYAGLECHLAALQTCSQGVPPGVEIGLTFYQNKDAILIDSFDGTPGAAVSAKPDYKVKKFRYFYLFLFTFDFILDHSHTIQSACPNWSLFNRGFQSL